MKKKVNVFGKGIPVFVIVLLGLTLVSAALLPYFAQITGLVTLNQGLTVDGNNWDVPIEYSEPVFTSLEAKTVSSDVHTLENTADVATEVKLITTCVETGTSDGCDDVTTTPVFELSIDGVSNIDGDATDQDRVVAKANGIDIDTITTLDFEYMLTETTNGNSPYFVLVFDTTGNGEADNWVVSWQDQGMEANTWLTHGNGLNYHNTGACTQQTPCDWAGLKVVLGSANLLQVKVMIGYWGDYTPTTALVKNIKVNGVNVVDNGLIIRQKDTEDHYWTEDDTEYGERIVDFSIETYFPQMMKPDTYTITTEVVLA